MKQLPYLHIDTLVAATVYRVDTYVYLLWVYNIVDIVGRYRSAYTKS